MMESLYTQSPLLLPRRLYVVRPRKFVQIFPFLTKDDKKKVGQGESVCVRACVFVCVCVCVWLCRFLVFKKAIVKAPLLTQGFPDSWGNLPNSVKDSWTTFNKLAFSLSLSLSLSLSSLTFSLFGNVSFPKQNSTWSTGYSKLVCFPTRNTAGNWCPMFANFYEACQSTFPGQDQKLGTL